MEPLGIIGYFEAAATALRAHLDAPPKAPDAPTEAPDAPTTAPDILPNALDVSTKAPVFHGSPIHARMCDVSEREINLRYKLASALQSFTDDLEKHSCPQATMLQGHDGSPSAAGNDFLESSKQIRELYIDVRALLEAEQSLRGSLLSSLLDGPGDLRTQALAEHRKMVTAFLLKDHRISDALSDQSCETDMSSEETPHGRTALGPEESGDEGRDIDMAKD